MSDLQGIQVKLPVTQVKKLRAIQNSTNIDVGALLEVVIDEQLDNVLQDKIDKVMSTNNQRTLARIKALNGKPEPKTKPLPKPKGNQK